MVQGLAGVYGQPAYGQPIYATGSVYNTLEQTVSLRVYEQRMDERRGYGTLPVYVPQYRKPMAVPILAPVDDNRGTRVSYDPRQISGNENQIIRNSQEKSIDVVAEQIFPTFLPRFAYRPKAATEDYSMNKQEENKRTDDKRTELAKRVLMELKKIRPAMKPQEHAHEDGVTHSHY